MCLFFVESVILNRLFIIMIIIYFLRLTVCRGRFVTDKRWIESSVLDSGPGGPLL